MTGIGSVGELDFAPRNDVFPSPYDWRDLFIYFLLVDRFDNNQPDLPPYDPASTPKGRDPAQGAVFQGGNLRGIIRRLDYIRGLGANAIWLSPVFKNRQEKPDSYHGYGIQNFLEVEPRFGTLEDLRELVRQAHAKGMYVILDIILNHKGDNWAYPGDQPYYFWKEAPGPFDFGFWRQVDPTTGLQEHDAVWPREFQNQDRYKRRGQIRDWGEHDEAINGDFLSLKELDINQPAVLTSLSYSGRNSRIEGTNERFPSLDAALDFPLYFTLEESIKGMINPSDLRERYERFKTLYTDHGEAGRYFVTFVDNHDQMSRPYRRFMHRNPYPDQATLAIGYLLTSQGVPCIYYGTEQGFDGGGDSDRYVRECMFGGQWGAFETVGHHCFDTTHPVYQAITRIAAVRRREPALRYGRQYFREISGNGTDFGYPIDGRCTLAYSRILDDTEIVIAMNLDTLPRQDYVTRSEE